MTSPAQPAAPARAGDAAITLFPDAPAGAVAPESARALYRARLRQWRQTHGQWVWIWLIAEIAVPAVLAAAGLVTASLIALLAGLIPPIVVLLLQWGHASDSFWNGYAHARGLQEAGRHWSGADVPLLRLGDERKVHRVLTGRVGDDTADIVQYTYTEVSYDDEGRRQETDHDYMLVVYRLPPAVAGRFQGIYLRRSGISLGALQDKLAHDRAIQLESSSFNKRYDLRAVDEQDDVALYELFSTTFIDQLTEGPVTQWEQAGPSLVVFDKGHRQETARLDMLCATAAAVQRRYLQEDR